MIPLNYAPQLGQLLQQAHSSGALYELPITTALLSQFDGGGGMEMWDFISFFIKFVNVSEP
jgi:hypothetical protein